jgi:predicted transposase YbfD/YdcC
MDQLQYSKLIDALRHVPDPRHARGKQLEWTMILGVIACALLCQQRSIVAIADWVQHHRAFLLATFHPVRQRLPSEATIRRALRAVNVVALEQHVAALRPDAGPQPTSDLDSVHGYAVDGKYVRGAGMHDHPTLLVSLVQHTSAQVLGQTAVPDKRHESHGVAEVLTGQALQGMVITLDAGLTHPTLATQIVSQGGHYFMVVKRNQARLYQELTWYFDTPPLPCDRPWRTHTNITKGHGRLEQRVVTCTDDLDDYLTWPGVQQVLRRECERTTLRTGVVSSTVTYALTSLPTRLLSVEGLAQLWRGHWTIENRVHYVRDVTFGEDAHQMSSGSAPQALAALRNALINRLRAAGWTNIAAALRHYANSISEVVPLIDLSSNGR